MDKVFLVGMQLPWSGSTEGNLPYRLRLHNAKMGRGDSQLRPDLKKDVRYPSLFMITRTTVMADSVIMYVRYKYV